MRHFRKALAGLAIISALYLALLIWADASHNVFDQLASFWKYLPMLSVFASSSYLLRYTRWRRLLNRASASMPFVDGFTAYLAGFAFTASPGKVGELFRIRYFTQWGSPSHLTISAFLFERAFDLVVVMGLAMLAVTRFGFPWVPVVFTLTILAILYGLTRYPSIWNVLSTRLQQRAHAQLPRALSAIGAGLSGIRQWLNLPDVLYSLVIGLAAWSTTSLAFVWLLGSLGVDLPFLVAFAIYPLAMLAGAASMLPGGIGSTEVVIVALLKSSGVDLPIAILAAVYIRLGTLWFAILVGTISMLLSEKTLARAYTKRAIVNA